MEIRRKSTARVETVNVDAITNLVLKLLTRREEEDTRVEERLSKLTLPPKIVNVLNVCEYSSRKNEVLAGINETSKLLTLPTSAAKFVVEIEFVLNVENVPPRKKILLTYTSPAFKIFVEIPSILKDETVRICEESTFTSKDDVVMVVVDKRREESPSKTAIPALSKRNRLVDSATTVSMNNLEPRSISHASVEKFAKNPPTNAEDKEEG